MWKEGLWSRRCRPLRLLEENKQALVIDIDNLYLILVRDLEEKRPLWISRDQFELTL
jgi:hypothetical protein